MKDKLSYQNPRVAVVVTVRNGGSNFEKLLRGISAQYLLPYEVSITDAYSTDGTWDRLIAWANKQPFKVIAKQVSGNISVGRNAAIAEVSSPWFAVTDADMELPPSWLGNLMAHISPKIGVVGAPNHGSRDTWLDRATNVLPMHGPSQQVVQVFGRNRFTSAFTTDSDHFAAVTRNCLYRTEAVRKVGGFDESLLTAEDGELNRRILDAGWRIHYTPNAPVFHRHRSNLRGFIRQIRNYALGQAQANRRRLGIRNGKHALPSLALALAALLVPISLVLAPTLLLLLLGPAGVLLLYALRAHRTQRSGVAATLLVAVVWQLTWALYYPLGYLGIGVPSHHAG